MADNTRSTYGNFLYELQGSIQETFPSEAPFLAELSGFDVHQGIVDRASAVKRITSALDGNRDRISGKWIRDTIILSDFVNNTNEPVFDGALKVALAVALEQSTFLKVFPDDSVRETLRLMQRSPDERVTRQLARDIARREQLKALVAGSIGKLGSHYVLALEAVNAESGDVMAREQVEAAGAEQVLTALGGATSRLRQKLGDDPPQMIKTVRGVGYVFAPVDDAAR
jgi:hypothetical protein